MDNKDQDLFKQCQVNVYPLGDKTTLVTHHAIQCGDTLIDIHKENPNQPLITFSNDLTRKWLYTVPFENKLNWG